MNIVYIFGVRNLWMLMTLSEPTSLQDGETIHLNLWFELTTMIFLKLTIFHMSRPSMFKHV